MRVIAGTLRGRAILAPGTPGVRPTYDRVRESLFSMLEPSLRGASVLDLFAGSGSLGIESLSRGAARATFVEADPRVLRVVRDNVKRLGLSARSRLVRGDAVTLLRGTLPGAPFDLVFVDPPYSSGLARPTLTLLGTRGLLAEGAVAAVERAAGDEPPDEAGCLVRRRSKRYGGTAVDLYEARGASLGREEQP